MQRSLPVTMEKAELGLSGPTLESIATASASALKNAGKRGQQTGSEKKRYDHSFSDMKTALDLQRETMGRASTLLPRLGIKSPASSHAIERINLALQTANQIERRKLPRRALSLKCTLEADGSIHDMHCIDINAMGVRICSPQPPTVAIGKSIALHIEKFGSVQCIVKNKGKHGFNLEFCLPLKPVERAIMAGILLGLSVEQDVMMSMARELALCIENAFEKNLAENAITGDDLFDTSYRPIIGTSPQQFTTRATQFHELTLPPIMDLFKHRHGRVIYAVATDRNGYVPVHNAPYNQPQQRHDHNFNLMFARNKRIYHDTATLRAARFSKEAIVQSYPRDMLHHKDALVMDASAPLFVRGRRWGCAQIGFSIHSS